MSVGPDGLPHPQTRIGQPALRQWNEDDYDVVADGDVVGRIYKVNAAPVGTPWMWTLAFGTTKMAVSSATPSPGAGG